MTRNGRQHTPRPGGRTADLSRDVHQANAQPTTSPDTAALATASAGQILGHSSVSQTAAYTHVLADRKAAAARAVEEHVFGRTEVF